MRFRIRVPENDAAGPGEALKRAVHKRPEPGPQAQGGRAAQSCVRVAGSPGAASHAFYTGVLVTPVRFIMAGPEARDVDAGWTLQIMSFFTKIMKCPLTKETHL